jgi:hypothetical protein
MLNRLKLNNLFKKIVPKEELNENQLLVKDVLSLMLSTDGTEAITAPISGKYYISNEKLGYYIMIGDFSVSISNHKFTFEQSVSVKFREILIDVVKKYMEQSRLEFEKRIFNNRTELLKSIKNNLLINK